MEHIVPATTISLSSLRTIGGFVDHTAIVADEFDTPLFLTSLQLDYLRTLPMASGFFVTEAKLYNLLNHIAQAVCKMYACSKYLQTKVIRDALTNRCEWIFIFIKFNDNHDGASYQRSNIVKFNTMSDSDGQLVIPGSWPDIIAAILSLGDTKRAGVCYRVAKSMDDERNVGAGYVGAVACARKALLHIGLRAQAQTDSENSNTVVHEDSSAMTKATGWTLRRMRRLGLRSSGVTGWEGRLKRFGRWCKQLCRVQGERLLPLTVSRYGCIGLAEEPQLSTSKSKRSCRAGLLNSDAACHPAHRKPVTIPVMSPIPHSPRPLPIRDPHTFPRFLRKLLPYSSRTDAVRTDEPHNPLDFPATSPLPCPLTKPDESVILIRTRITHHQILRHQYYCNPQIQFISISTWWPFQPDHASSAVADVPLALGKLRYATAGAPGDEDDMIRNEDYVSPPSPNPASRPGIVNTGQHGSGRVCFCF
ncbi:hypothetical protein F4604DRAFT_1994211 [Suillus subluteus]|nr:hypothetical protein F4604DRAFT_1994211 [Suillus subluteus]